MRSLQLSICIVLLAASACVQNEPDPLRSGPWHMSMDLSTLSDTGPVQLPVHFTVERGDSSYRFIFHNGNEELRLERVALFGDSLYAQLPLYDSYFTGHVQGDSLIVGHWNDISRPEPIRIAFTASAGQKNRFPRPVPAAKDLSGEWRTIFTRSNGMHSDALAIFHQEGDHLTGTFATATGDQRFLEGSVSGDSLFLSTFNGSQANLFTAQFRNDTLYGVQAGIGGSRYTWKAFRDPSFILPDAYTLTALDDNNALVHFSYPDLDGNLISPQDEQRTGKVILVQILGSWCPNCVDEALLFQQLHNRYHKAGLEVIGLAFERPVDSTVAMRSLERFRNHLHLEYPICYLGSVQKANVQQKLPFVETLRSYPTSILMDRRGKVRMIHTGFYGPSTGAHYTEHRRTMQHTIEQLLNEPG